MKTRCDNDCKTCSISAQAHCSVIFAKENNALLKELLERMDDLEESVDEFIGSKPIEPILKAPTSSVQGEEETNSDEDD